MSDGPPRRLSRGLGVVALEDRLIVAGGRRRVFRGGDATDLLPRLLPLLDGTRSHDEIRAELGLSAARLTAVLDTLERDGLLDDAVPAPASLATAHVRTYLSRTAHVHGYGGSRARLEELARAAVHIVGDAAPAAGIGNDLRDCGVGRITIGSARASPMAVLEEAERSLIVVIDSVPARRALDDTFGLAGARRAVPVLRVAMHRGHVEIGPCFLDGYSACPECLRRGRRDAAWDEDEPLDAHEVEPVHGSVEALAGLAASAAFAVLTGSPTAWPSRTVTRIGLEERTSERHLVAPYPGCPCGARRERDTGDDERDIGDEAAFLADTFEWSMARPAPPRLRTKGPTGGETRSWDALTTQRPELLAHPVLDLPEEAVPVLGALGDTGGPPGSADLRTLADVLRRTAGLRPGPTESVELYLCTAERVPGIPGTLFRYDDIAHRLIAMARDPVPPAVLLAGTDLRPEETSAVLVFVAAHARLAEKHRDFAHRLAHLDAGCVAARLAAVASGHGLPVEFASRWDGRIGETLDLAPEGQYVTAVAGMRRPGPGGDVPCP
ncbi:TOMM precursor leader peptide-binding protein [Spirillospora sp. NBC_00431]